MTVFKDVPTEELLMRLGEQLSVICSMSPMWMAIPGSWTQFAIARRIAEEIQRELVERFKALDEKIDELRAEVQEWKEDSGR